MMLLIDSQSTVAPFEQVRAGILAQVQDARLAPGAQLPTVRALAGQLGLAVNTVAKAYRELEADRVIETRGRAGSFVAATGNPAHRLAQEAAQVFAARMRQLDISPVEALALAKAALA